MEELEEMEKEQKKEIIEAIESKRLYDFIASNQYRIDDDIIRDLLLETIATLKENQRDELIENLREYKEW